MKVAYCNSFSTCTATTLRKVNTERVEWTCSSKSGCFPLFLFATYQRGFSHCQRWGGIVYLQSSTLFHLESTAYHTIHLLFRWAYALVSLAPPVSEQTFSEATLRCSSGRPTKWAITELCLNKPCKCDSSIRLSTIIKMTVNPMTRIIVGSGAADSETRNGRKLQAICGMVLSSPRRSRGAV